MTKMKSHNRIKFVPKKKSKFVPTKVDVDIQTSSSHHIDALIKQEGVVWRFTGFYGHPETSRRGESWDLLRQLHASFSLPWLLLGDFNKTLLLDKYWGSGSRPYN